MTLNATDSLPFVEKKRIRSLDALRGFASLSVVMAHCLGGLAYNKILESTPFYLIKSAHEAVIFFFLLSGYVLVFQANGQASKFHYIKFLVLRFCRIYVPYLVSVLICFFLYNLSYGKVTDHTWIGSQWRDRLTPEIIWNHIALVGNFNTNSFNPVIWSLVHEMRFAILFPLVLFALRYSLRNVAFLALFAFICIGIVLAFYPELSLGFDNSYLFTIYYLMIFVSGGILALNQANLLNLYSECSKRIKVLVTGIAFMLYIYSHKIPFLLTKFHGAELVKFSFILEDLLTTIAAFYFVVLAISISNKGTILEKGISLFFGRISYSLYLIHIPVICFIYKELTGIIQPAGKIAIGLFLSVLFSFLFNIYVEQKAARLGRFLTNKQ